MHSRSRVPASLPILVVSAALGGCASGAPLPGPTPDPTGCVRGSVVPSIDRALGGSYLDRGLDRYRKLDYREAAWSFAMAARMGSVEARVLLDKCLFILGPRRPGAVIDATGPTSQDSLPEPEPAPEPEPEPEPTAAQLRAAVIARPDLLFEPREVLTAAAFAIPAEAAEPEPRGVVVAVRAIEDAPRYPLVLISVGKDDGVTRYQRFELRRSGATLGTIVAEKVMPDMTGCRVYELRDERLPEEGDRVVPVRY